MTDSHQYITQQPGGGLLIHVPRNQRVEQPIRITIERRPDEPLEEQRDIEIRMDDCAQARIIFNDRIKEADGPTHTVQNIRIVVGENSQLEVYEVEETYSGHRRESVITADQKSYSRLTLLSLTLQAGQTVNHTTVHLNGRGAEATLLGGVIADGQQRVENHTLIDHAVPECTSNELYKYVLDGNAVGVFEGRILVQKDAQKSISQETNANLVSTKTARMFTQPALEIYADDVKCSHGATVGSLNADEQFYMRSRGISEAQARRLQMISFLAPALESVGEDVRETVMNCLTELL